MLVIGCERNAFLAQSVLDAGSRDCTKRGLVSDMLLGPLLCTSTIDRLVVEESMHVFDRSTDSVDSDRFSNAMESCYHSHKHQNPSSGLQIGCPAHLQAGRILFKSRRSMCETSHAQDFIQLSQPGLFNKYRETCKYLNHNVGGKRN